jgi:hypothetical protein
MRATQDNIQEEIHEEEDEMRTTNAVPSGRVRDSHTKGKPNEKGKRKSEKHEALCEAEHRKTKKNKQTKKHDQQKRKRHRETDTLRADAGKKVRPALGQATKTIFPACRVGV